MTTERPHYHACLQCGDTWQHVTPDDGCSHEDWMAAHTCKNGHFCDVKLPARFVAGLLRSGDPLRYARAIWPELADYYERKGHS